MQQANRLRPYEYAVNERQSRCIDYPLKNRRNEPQWARRNEALPPSRPAYFVESNEPYGQYEGTWANEDTSATPARRHRGTLHCNNHSSTGDSISSERQAFPGSQPAPREGRVFAGYVNIHRVKSLVWF